MAIDSLYRAAERAFNARAAPTYERWNAGDKILGLTTFATHADGRQAAGLA